MTTEILYNHNLLEKLIETKATVFVLYIVTEEDAVNCATFFKAEDAAEYMLNHNLYAEGYEDGYYAIDCETITTTATFKF